MNDVAAQTVMTRPLSEAAQAIPDARADSRVGVDFPIQVFSGDFSGGLPAVARDLSVSGVCLATRSMFSFKSIHKVVLDLEAGAVELEAQGRWQSQATSDDSTLTGVSFTAPDPDGLSRLWGVVLDASKDLGLFLFDRSDLSGLCADDATNLANCSRKRLVSARRRIYRQDEWLKGDDSIFVVLSGEVNLTVQIGNRKDLMLERLKPGCIFGGLPAIANVPNQESAIAEIETTLLEISRPSLAYLRVVKPMLAQRLGQIVTRGHFRRSRKLLELVSLPPT